MLYIYVHAEYVTYVHTYIIHTESVYTIHTHQHYTIHTRMFSEGRLPIDEDELVPTTVLSKHITLA